MNMEAMHNNENQEKKSAGERIQEIGEKIDHKQLWPILSDNIKARKKEQAEKKIVTNEELSNLERTNELGNTAKERSEENNVPNMEAILKFEWYA